MKPLVCFLIAVCTMPFLHSQTSCENFNANVVAPFVTNGTCSMPIILGNWHARQASLKYDNFASQGGASDVYLRIRDVASGSCSSWIFNNVDYHGDWSGLGDCLCYDFRFFSDGGVPTAPTLLQIYSGGPDPFSATYVAEFVLFSPVTIADGWVNICPPMHLATAGLPENSLGRWEMRTPMGGGAAEWNALLTNVSGLAFKVDINAGTELYGIDNICFQDCPPGQEPSQPETAFCCPGVNLIVNGDFEAGNTGFTSSYLYNPSVTTNATLPGQYNIVTGQDASNISSGWVVQDAFTCSNSSGKFLVANGSACGGTQKVVWEQNLTVTDWRSYKFCLSAKNLRQCNFDVIPNLEIQFSMPGIGNITQTINVTPGACDWYNLSKHIDLWGYGTNLNIKILLDESQLGDGNDLALDNIALIEVPRVPDPQAAFGVSPPTDLGGGYYTRTATAAAIPSTFGNCGVYWEIVRLDATYNEIPGSKITNPSQWWPLPAYATAINFPGSDGMTNTLLPFNNITSVPAGKFRWNERYKITRGVFCDCWGWNQASIIIEPQGNNLVVMDGKTRKIIRTEKKPKSR